MNTVTVNKLDLIGALRHNRDKHIAIVHEAEATYRVQAIERLQHALKMIEKGHPAWDVLNNIRRDFPKPEDFTYHYDCVLEMLSMCRESDFRIDQGQFDEYVMDNWPWKNSFTSVNSRYSKILQSGGAE